jgi:hypothetical protein
MGLHSCRDGDLHFVIPGRREWRTPNLDKLLVLLDSGFALTRAPE